jgi:ElaB/YqjD/DUF883 family membrane-anchored ribosome-binding protein
MDNNAMQQGQEYGKPPMAQQAWNTARQIGSKAANAAGEGLTKVADATEDTVRKYPLAAVGVALGCGVALGALVTGLAMPRPKTFTERLGEYEIAKKAMKLFGRLF